MTWRYYLPVKLDLADSLNAVMQCLIQDKIFTSPPRAVVSRGRVAPRGRRTARSSNWAILLFSDIKFNNIIITTNNYIYLLKSNSIMLQVIVHNKNNSEN